MLIGSSLRSLSSSGVHRFHPACSVGHVQLRGTVIRSGERRMVIRSKTLVCDNRKCNYRFSVPIVIE